MPMNKESIKRVRTNVGKVVGEINGPRTDAAVRTILQQGMTAAMEMTPVATSFLINSGYAPVVSNGKGYIGFTAAYASAVHEASGKLKGKPRTPNRNGTSRGNYWDPTGEPKFLEKGFNELKPQIPAILKMFYKGGKK